MANPYINKVILGNETLLDLTADTVTAGKLASGITAHDKSGAPITGTAKLGSAYQDQDGYIVLGDDESDAPQGTLSITANGTYDVADYAGANVAIPVGMTETDLKNFIQRSNSFTDIDWPDGITTIGAYAFAYCRYFNPSSLPSTIRYIREYAFYYCNLRSLTSLPSRVDTIGVRAFANSDIVSITIPDTAENIAYYTFYYCRSLVQVTLPSSMTSIPYGMFEYCSSLSSIIIPSSVTDIGNTAFHDCASITLSSLPSGLTSIGQSAFCGCAGITSISCDGAITSLGSSAFIGDSNYAMTLVSASFPNMALTSNIGSVFGASSYACQLLEFCDIGSTVGINGNAFANCYALQTLVLRKSDAICTLANVSAFTNTPMSGYNNLTGTVYVPQALISTYQTATNWSTLYNAGTVTFAAIEGSEYERD